MADDRPARAASSPYRACLHPHLRPARRAGVRGVDCGRGVLAGVAPRLGPFSAVFLRLAAGTGVSHLRAGQRTDRAGDDPFRLRGLAALRDGAQNGAAALRRIQRQFDGPLARTPLSARSCRIGSSRRSNWPIRGWPRSTAIRIPSSPGRSARSPSASSVCRCGACSTGSDWYGCTSHAPF